jgi:hypothetical protein
MEDLAHRRLLLGVIVLTTVCALVLTVVAYLPDGPVNESAAARSASSTMAATGSSGTTERHTWWSGASGRDAANGRYAAWRGEPVRIGGAWANGDAEQVQMFEICNPRGDWVRWTGPLDLAIGAIDVTRGETWAAAARGVYDARWRQHLERTKACWGARDPSQLFLRFAHNLNVQQVPWRVRHGEERDFVTALTRYSDLRYSIMPGLRIVLSPSDSTDPRLGGLDLRALWPGKDARGRAVADVYGVDFYNRNPHVTTAAEATRRLTTASVGGQPLGIEQHRRLAETLGVPFAIPEWGNNADSTASGGGGESPAFVQTFHDWAAAHSGDPSHPVPGQLLYEIHFNVGTEYAFWPITLQPRTAAVYHNLTWGTSSPR